MGEQKRRQQFVTQLTPMTENLLARTMQIGGFAGPVGLVDMHIVDAKTLRPILCAGSQELSETIALIVNAQFGGVGLQRH